ncbi:MAG: LPS export ABC transporter periplasmic protein LptC [Gammaproteobacteria bacterium]|nr:LPS export ABC transporter periplasmic protein LptC [Gammaproteobacteria bacterium]
MKISSIAIVLGAGLIAIAAGWVYQSQTTTSISKPELEIPVDIDYFLSRVKYRVMAKSGKLDYELSSPYLQHFKQQDISRLETPEIKVFRNQEPWQMLADRAELQHQENILEFVDNVRLQSKNTDIMADKAIFDLDENIYHLTNTKAIYYNENG